MPPKTIDAVFLVDSKHIDEHIVSRYRATLDDSEKRSRVVRVKTVSLVPGTRSYMCQVVGTEEQVKLSSKALAQFEPSGNDQPLREGSRTVVDETSAE